VFELISIVIPAYNAESTIARAIQGAMSQDYRGPNEIIVVDDGSTDTTPKIVQTFKNVRYICQKNGGPAKARNAGAQASRGEIIFFTDADAIPRPNWISTILVHFDDPLVAVVAGSYGQANPEFILASCIQAELDWRHARIGECIRAFGSYNVAIRRPVFEEVGGFNESYYVASAEDNDLSYRLSTLGYSILFEPASKVDHHHPARPAHYLMQQKQHGIWRVRLYKDHPDMRSGDDYTFWKDIVEPPWVILMGIVAGLVALSWVVAPSASRGLLLLCVVLALGLFFFQIFFSFRMIRRFWLSLYYSAIMFLRALARTMGFLQGVLGAVTKARRSVRIR
jgi:glycosyltransferase involved in cell wall biosynthesis